MTTPSTTQQIRLRNIGNGRYGVLSDGDPVGEVYRVERYYNLYPRPATYTYWRISLDPRSEDPRVKEDYSSRAEAVAMLVTFLQETR